MRLRRAGKGKINLLRKAGAKRKKKKIEGYFDLCILTRSEDMEEQNLTPVVGPAGESQA